MLSRREREERAEARLAERRAREPTATERTTAAYLHAMRYRGEDVREMLRGSEPPARCDHEVERMNRSREWLAQYLKR